MWLRNFGYMNMIYKFIQAILSISYESNSPKNATIFKPCSTPLINKHYNLTYKGPMQTKIQIFYKLIFI